MQYPFMQYGWICPKCGASNAPFVPQCCEGHQPTFTASSFQIAGIQNNPYGTDDHSVNRTDDKKEGE